MASDTGAAKVTEGRITPEALAEFKSRIGTTFRVQQANELASNETIVNYCRGVGDVNPLFNDPGYGQKTRYGCLVASPSWVYSTAPGAQQGLRGVHGFHSGDDWVFYKPILVGDRIKAQQIFSGVEEKPSSFAGRMVIEYHDKLYNNQRGELVAKAKGWIIRTERGEAKKVGKYSKIQLPHPWTDEELKKVDDEIMAEEIRGDRVRYWEDVKVGEELPAVVKGPLGITDEIAYCAGCGQFYLKAHKTALMEYRRHPAWAFRDRDTLSWEPMFAVHYNVAAAKAAGVPYPYAWGRQLQSWQINLFTNWMGDEGWLKASHCEYRRFVYLSDVVWNKGKVTKKYVDENSEYCVDIETGGFNQRGEDTIPGRGTVILPSRDAGTWPVANRLPPK